MFLRLNPIGRTILRLVEFYLMVGKTILLFDETILRSVGRTYDRKNDLNTRRNDLTIGGTILRLDQAMLRSVEQYYNSPNLSYDR